MNQEMLKKQIGQRICAGFIGTEVTEEIRQLIREWKVGNILLFSRNVVSFPQLKRLCGDLEELIRAETGLPPLIMIDEECGTVSRLGHLTGETPSAGAIGATNDPENARAIGNLIGRRLRAAGINMNLAPVLDCLTQPKNRVMGNRCFSGDPEKVARFGKAYIEGLHAAGVMTCGKHFPGHGDTATDSHYALPTIAKPVDALEKTELVPFRAAIAAGTEAMMSAHIRFPALDDVPATISERILKGLLREEMGFGGLIVSDGMEMQAMLNLFPIPEGVLRALQAGVDIALVCHEPAQAAAACRRAVEAAAAGKISEAEIEEHDRRIRAAKGCIRPSAGAEADFSNAADRETARRIMAQAVRIIHCPGGKDLPKIGKETRFSGSFSRRGTPAAEDKHLNAAGIFAERCNAQWIPEGETGNAGIPETAVVFLETGDGLEEKMAEIRKWASSGTKVIAVALDTPEILTACPDNVWQIAAWQYQMLALDAVYDMLKRGQ